LDLGRDVAMKVLLERHTGTRAIVRRFVEEARIGGRLQHPGVVPVYEFGLRTDRRPFFTMKLVRGRTLADLLEERAEPPRILAVFSQVCQTVAYAHARGVVHRDLKPEARAFLQGKGDD
jgi:serine/threonine protein kinase